MSKFKNRSIIIFAFVMAIFSPKSFEEQAVIKAYGYSSLEIDNSILQNGDIIFRRGISLVSSLVLATDKHSPYSHVGIILIELEKPYVIHAVPDESENGIDYIRKDPIEMFLRNDRASAYEILRFPNKAESDSAALQADKFFSSMILFDDGFSLEDSSKYYCTEMVWRAYKNAGVDLINNKFDTLSVPIGKNPFILPGTLLKNQYTKPLTKKSFF